MSYTSSGYASTRGVVCRAESADTTPIERTIPGLFPIVMGYNMRLAVNCVTNAVVLLRHSCYA
jgi:hypothetical protein